MRGRDAPSPSSSRSSSSCRRARQVRARAAAGPPAWYRGAVVRLFLAVWLAAFAVQSTNLLASVIPDDCVEDTSDSAADPCSDNCARCICCARIPVFVPYVLAATPAELPVIAAPHPPLTPSTTASPRGVLHVPKAL